MAVPSNRVPVRVARGLKSALTANLADLLEGELVYAKDEDKLYMIEGGTLVAMGADLAAASILDLGDVEPNSLPDGARYALGGVQFPGNGLWYISGSRISWGAIDADAVDRTSQITTASGSIFWSTDGANWTEIFFTGSVQGLVTDSYYIDITSGTLPTLSGDLYLSFSTPGAGTPAPLADGDYLRYDGTDFRPQQLATVAETGAYSDLSGTPTLGTAAAAATTDFATAAQGTTADSAVQPTDSIDALADVDTTTAAPTTGQVLEWDGTNWVPATPSGGGGVTRIQDATDYEPNTTPPTGTIYYFPKAIANFPEDWTCPDQGTYSTDPGDGTQYNLARYDRDGRDIQSAFPSSGSIWWTFDLTQPWTEMTYTGTGAQSICSANSRRAFNGTVNGWPLDGSTDKMLYVALSDLGTGIPIPLAAGDYLRYDGGDFRPKQLATVAETGAYSDLSGTPTLVTSIDDLTDVDTSTASPTNDQVLAWNGTNWVPADGSAISGGISRIQDATDYEPYYLAGGARYTWATGSDPGNGKWYLWTGTQFSFGRSDADGINRTAEITAATGSIFWSLDGLNWNEVFFSGSPTQTYTNSYRVDITSGPSPTAGQQIYIYFATPSPTPRPLNDGEILQWKSSNSKFRPQAIATVATSGSYNDLANLPTLGTAAATDSTAYATAAQGTLADNAVQPTDSIGTLADVTVSTPSNGEALVWNGSAWVNNTVSTVGSIDDLTDVDTTTAAPTTGQVLEWNGTNWVPATVSSGGGLSGIGVATRVSDSGTAASSALTLTGLGSSGMLHTLSTDLDAWVVFYGSAADRTADAGRAYNTDPAAGSGVLAEAYVTTAGAILFTPGTGYMNNDTTETAALYLAVRDQAGAAVNATLTVTAYVQGGYTGVSGGTFGSG